MVTIYVYILDTLADWELGYVTAELNSGRFFKKMLETKELFYTGHCTGSKTFAIMKEIMGGQLQTFHSGSFLGI